MPVDSPQGSRSGGVRKTGALGRSIEEVTEICSSLMLRTVQNQAGSASANPRYLTKQTSARANRTTSGLDVSQFVRNIVGYFR